MSTITLEKSHALLTKLAEYVMNELPKMDAKLSKLDARMDQLDARMDQLDTRMDRFDTRIDHFEARLEQKADKQDLKRIEDKIDMLLEGMDAQAGQLDFLRTEMAAVSKTLDVHNERLGKLEQHNFGYQG
jgi:peptidoglycan hydrolase CwlO-like protein